MDVVAVYDEKVVVAECKALKSQIDGTDVSHWLRNRIPAFRDWIKTQAIYSQKVIEFEYWSTSGFTADASRMLSDAANTTRQYAIKAIDGKTLRAEIVRRGNKKMKEALDNYFLIPQV